MSDYIRTPEPSTTPENRTIAPTPHPEASGTPGTAERAKAALKSSRERAAQTLNEAAETTSRVVDEKRHDLEKAYRQTATRTSDFAREHPFAVGAMGLVAGFALGALLPRTKMENGTVGATRDDLFHKATEAGSQALKETRRMAEKTVQQMNGGDATKQSDEEQALEEGLEDSFPASDPISVTSVSKAS
ncbi:hypothetical protein [Roseibium polysiphoniae]|uniref:DUF3618 domain-containing protein n=1 Tax=Roseibium polysiphoniae TaxID=2571221 RepID=A0ABR9C9N9_9HYPH|nr:hypothetical protein [Roseibium polysiphoniae]MBD8876624.1 hypothetical protein [Roseibium polysiphoniae]